MPQYFFHVAHETSSRDLIGSNFASLDEAKIYTVKCATQLALDDPKQMLRRNWSIHVQDENGRDLFSFGFTDITVPDYTDV